MDFIQLRNRLVHGGLVFDEETLKELAYVDLVRAGIGDAGPAACSLELVKAERQRRIAEVAARIIKMRMNPSGPHLVEEPELFMAAQRALHELPASVLEWDKLHPLTQAYILIRCLRAHIDSPVPRLTKLREVLEVVKEGEATDTAVRRFVVLMVSIFEDQIRRYSVKPPEILRFRRDTFEFYKFLRLHVPVAEQPGRNHLEVNGYHCTQGCFLPGDD